MFRKSGADGFIKKQNKAFQVSNLLPSKFVRCEPNQELL